jgi:hypothetical protein
MKYRVMNLLWKAVGYLTTCKHLVRNLCQRKSPESIRAQITPRQATADMHGGVLNVASENNKKKFWKELICLLSLHYLKM